MSNKPRIFANCPAGCKWETVHKDDFLNSASIVEMMPNDDGSFDLEVGKTYKLLENGTDVAWKGKIQVAFDHYQKDGGNITYRETVQTLAFPTKNKFYNDLISVKVLGFLRENNLEEQQGFDFGENLYFELNGKSYKQTAVSYGIDIADFRDKPCPHSYCTVKATGFQRCFRVNEDARIVLDANTVKSTVLIGQDENGGNIYEQTFGDNTKVRFVAPRGIDGVTLDGSFVVGVDEETGDIFIITEDGNKVPNIEYDEEMGDLFHVFEEKETKVCKGQYIDDLSGGALSFVNSQGGEWEDNTNVPDWVVGDKLSIRVGGKWFVDCCEVTGKPTGTMPLIYTDLSTKDVYSEMNTLIETPTDEFDNLVVCLAKPNIGFVEISVEISNGIVRKLLGNIKGATPTIGENGNWWVNGKDTGVSAKSSFDSIPLSPVGGVLFVDNNGVGKYFELTFNNKKATVMFRDGNGNTAVSYPINDDHVANKKFVLDKIAELVDSSPEALNTLNELAAALGNDENFSTTVMNLLGNKVNKLSPLTDVGMGAYIGNEDGTMKLVHVTSVMNPYTIAYRNKNGQCQFSAPTLDEHAANKGYVDNIFKSLTFGMDDNGDIFYEINV